MSGPPFTLVIPNDTTHKHVLNKYRTLTSYLLEQPEISAPSKLNIGLYQSMSKRIQVLEEIYKGMFHVTEPIKEMYTLTRILIDKCAKSIPLVIELDNTMDAVVITAVQSPEKSNIRTPTTPKAAIVPVDSSEHNCPEPYPSPSKPEDNLKRPVFKAYPQEIDGIDVDDKFVAEASAVVDAIDANNTLAVCTDEDPDSIRNLTDILVAASHTSIEGVSKLDAKSVPKEIMHKVRTLQESRTPETKIDPMDNNTSHVTAQMIGLKSTNQKEFPTQLEDSHMTGDLETIQQLEAELMATHRIEEIISKHKHGAGSVPPEYRLNNVLQTIMGIYPLKEKQRLSLPWQPGATANMVDAPTMAVHRARTQSQTRAASGSSQMEQ